MKRRVIVVLVLLLMSGALVGGWWWARTSPQQVTQFLVSGGLGASQAEAFVSLIGGRTQPQGTQPLVASGSIEGEEVSIVSELGGRIVALHAREGDEVLAEQVLVELDTSLLQAQKVQADAGVAAAEANLDNVKAGTHPAEILAAQAALRQALAEQDAAEAAWHDVEALLQNPQDIDAQIVEAQSAVDTAGPLIEQAKAKIAAAEEEQFQYRAQGTLEEKEMYVVYGYQVEAAQAALAAAQANKKGAEAKLAALKALRDNPLAIVSQVHQAKGQFELAAAAARAAEAKLVELEAGPTREEVAVAESQVAQARAALRVLEAQIDKMTLRSPIAGIVTSRSAHSGEAAIAGATLLTVANLDEVKLTIYVPENELGRVHLGQEVGVAVDSFPGRVFTGTVSHIAQQAEFTPKNVQTEQERVNMVFAVQVRIPNAEHLLKPGMPADATTDGG
jgi:HlyD family secretion protein